MSVEQELKLHVQAASRQAVKEIIDTATTKTIHLRAFTLTPVLENSHKQALHFACAKKMAFGYKPSNYPVMML